MAEGVATMTRYRVRLRILRKRFRFWYPGTDVVKEIVHAFGRHVENNDIVVVSEKALSVALGNVYDEGLIRVDLVTRALTYVTTRILWAKMLRSLFRSHRTCALLSSIPIDILSAHKKLALRYGGLKHFLKPISEAGIDTTNLPYRYVSLPLTSLRGKLDLDLLRLRICKSLGKHVNLLVIDTDKSFKPRFLRGLVLSSRPSAVRGVIDFGVYAYVAGKVLRRLFKPYPTPVAYSGIDIGLPLMLFIAKVCEKAMGYGFGRNIFEMMKALNKKSLEDITWADMDAIPHYPALLVKVKFEKVVT